MLVTRRKTIESIVIGTACGIPGCLGDTASSEGSSPTEPVVSLESVGDQEQFSFDADEGTSVRLELAYRGTDWGWFTLESPVGSQLFSLPVVETRQEMFPTSHPGTYSGTLLPDQRGSGEFDISVVLED